MRLRPAGRTGRGLSKQGAQMPSSVPFLFRRGRRFNCVNFLTLLVGALILLSVGRAQAQEVTAGTLYAYVSPDDTAGNNQLVLIDPTTGAGTQISGTIDSNGELSRDQSALGNHHYYFYLSSSSGDAILEQLYSADLSTIPSQSRRSAVPSLETLAVCNTTASQGHCMHT